MIEMPFINVRDMVIYPGMEQSLLIGREFTIKAIQHAVKHNKGRIVAITQKALENANPKKKSDMFSVGTICKVEQSVLMSDGAMKALLKAEKRVTIRKVLEKESVRFIEGNAIQDSTKQTRLDPVKKREVLELLLRWNPAIALDNENERFERLKKEGKTQAFLQQILALICHRKQAIRRDPKTIGTKVPKPSLKELKSHNLALKKRQALLEENNSERQFKMIREILLAEI
jgi:ATP-dependent Lon protease